MTSMEILSQIKQHDISFKLKDDLFELLEENHERIQFVTNHVNIRDFLFMAEKGTSYTADFFVSLDVECEPHFTFEQNVEKFSQKYVDAPLAAFSQVVDFFEKTNRILYVGVGFVECELTKEDELNILQEFRNGLIRCYDEGAKKYRRFPVWYQNAAVDPSSLVYVSKRTESAVKDDMRRIERATIQQEIDRILDKKVLTKRDKELLQELSYQLRE